MHHIDTGVAYTAAIMFASEGSGSPSSSNLEESALWLVVLLVLSIASVAFGVFNPELFASLWSLI